MEEDRLDGLQDLFSRVMFRLPESCPRIALRAEKKMIGMKQRIWLWQYKLLLLKRIKAQSPETLSRKIWEEQRKNNWPGLSAEVSDICRQLNIPDINDVDTTNGLIKKAIFDHHYSELKVQIANSKKMMLHKDDDFRQVQDYMKGKSVDNSRMAFRIRCEMVPDIKGNYKDKYRRKGGEEAFLGKDFLEIESQSHCVICPKWDNIRDGLQLMKMDDLVTFFKRLLVERNKDGNGSQRAAL